MTELTDASALTELTIALDWTPNAIHCGFYVAKAQGFYEAEGLQANIVPPSATYSKEETPARSVVTGRADFCVAPTESVISCWTSKHEANTRPVCVAAILQTNTSSIVSLKSGPVHTAADLAGRRYASYEGRFEMAIVNQLIKNAGGGALGAVEVLPPKLDCFEQVVNGTCDATWVFEGWEGLQAKARGIELNVFSLEKNNIPYGYAPCLLAANKYTVASSPESETLRKFLSATSKGYELAHADPALAADALYSLANHESLHSLGKPFVLEAQQYLSSERCIVDDDGKWGRMDPVKWSTFVDFLVDNKLLTGADGVSVVQKDDLQSSSLFTNTFL